MSANLATKRRVRTDLGELLKVGDVDTLGQVLDECGSLAARWLRHEFPFLRPFADEILADALFRIWLRRRAFDPAVTTVWRFFCEAVRDAAGVFLQKEIARQRRTAWCVEFAARVARRSNTPLPVGPILSPMALAQLPIVRELVDRLPPKDRDLVLSPLLNADNRWPAAIAAELGGDENHVRIKRRRLLRKIRRQLDARLSGIHGDLDDQGPYTAGDKAEGHSDVDAWLLQAWISAPPELPAEAVDVQVGDACLAEERCEDILAGALARIRAHQHCCAPPTARRQRRLLVAPLANHVAEQQRTELIAELVGSGEYVVDVDGRTPAAGRRLASETAGCHAILWPSLSRFSELAVALCRFAADRFEQDGSPVFVPLTDAAPFPYPLNHYLPAASIIKVSELALSDFAASFSRRIFFENSDDTIASVWRVPRTDPQAYRAGSTGADPWYVRRPIDMELDEVARQSGETTTIFGPRQSGKSSALQRYLDNCRHEANKSIIVIDFATAPHGVLTSFRTLAKWMVWQIRRQIWISNHLASAVPQSAAELGDFVEDSLLADGNTRMVLAFEQADRVLGHWCQQEFFAMLRAWHDRRRRPGSLWKQVDLVIVVSTDPFLLIDSPTISPFNVSRVISVEPFGVDESCTLNDLHGKSLANGHLQQLHELVGGHPYLTQLAHAWLEAKGAHRFDQLVQMAAADDGPFADHLHALLFRLVSELGVPAERALRDLVRRGQGGDGEAITRLQSAGLVRVDREGRASLANPVYGQFFGRVL